MQQEEGNISEVIQYIIRFLLRTEDMKLADKVGYTSEKSEFSKYNVVIRRSDFFDENVYLTKKSLPQPPLKTLEDIPLLFGYEGMENHGNTTIINGDLIAGTYFLLSRYEEVIRPEVRDVHGRFPGKESLPYKAGFIGRPIMDEYGKLLRKLLRETGVNVPEPENKIEKIYLTHDVDKLVHFRNWKSIGKAVLTFSKNIKTALKSYFGKVENDPWFTFSYFFQLATELRYAVPEKDLTTIFFIKTGGGKTLEDKPLQNIQSKDYKAFFELCKKENARFGLHPSYLAAEDKEVLSEEKKLLENVLGEKIKFTRNHYLRSKEPNDFNFLIEAGFTDDFTMGYADVAGFRLGTCRAVSWIDPQRKKLTNLLLHPLTLMDGTLSEEKYMDLPENEALEFSLKMIKQVKENTGELILLWHNTSVEKDNGFYHRDLYQKIIKYLKHNA